ncbi:hypothetical protein WANA31_1285 [Wolbachia endosymbiont of Drosophila ananassae]|nr:hypothetical protein WANA31_1285 [Wolbachia endosymbiont of Drosophila ananassae]RLT62170.1 hypothetical protein WANA34_1285 [Wolbachia endosymbiont of Drosophila ananassae]
MISVKLVIPLLISGIYAEILRCYDVDPEWDSNWLQRTAGFQIF